MKMSQHFKQVNFTSGQGDFKATVMRLEGSFFLFIDASRSKWNSRNNSPRLVKAMSQRNWARFTHRQSEEYKCQLKAPDLCAAVQEASEFMRIFGRCSSPVYRFGEVDFFEQKGVFRFKEPFSPKLFPECAARVAQHKVVREIGLEDQGHITVSLTPEARKDVEASLQAIAGLL